MLKETLPESARNSRESCHPDSLRQLWDAYHGILSDKGFRLYVSGSILVALVFLQLDLYMAVYEKESVPQQPLFSWGNWTFEVGGAEAFGWLVGINGLMVALLAVPVHRWFSGWSDRDALVLSSLLYGLGMFCMAFTTNIWLLIGCIVLLSLGELIRTPVAQTFVSKYAPEDKRGQYMGASDLQFSIGRFLAPMSIGLAGWLPPIGVFTFIFSCALGSAWAYVRMFRLLSMAPASASHAPDTRPLTSE